MNNNKDLPDSIQCLEYMIGNYNLTDKEQESFDYALRLLIEKRLSAFDLVKASDIDAGEEVFRRFKYCYEHKTSTYKKENNND